jgi:hypothetical protein
MGVGRYRRKTNGKFLKIIIYVLWRSRLEGGKKEAFEGKEEKEGRTLGCPVLGGAPRWRSVLRS